MKKCTKVFGLIAILMIIGSAFVGVVTAEEIIIDTEIGESRFTTYPPRELPYEWWYAQDHPDLSPDGWFDTKAYPPGPGNGNFWYTFSFPGVAEYKGIWETALPHSGNYEVFAGIPSPDPFDHNLDESVPPNVYLPTQVAKYKIFHKTEVDIVTIGQDLNKGGFKSLGVFDFDSTARVELSSNGVEFWRCVAFDAVKFVPVVNDMVVTDVSIIPPATSVGQSTAICVTVTNEGSQQEENVSVKAFVDGAQVGSTKYVSLDLGSSDTMTFLWIPRAAKNYSVVGEVGVGVRVVGGETDTGDNTKEIEVRVSPAPTPVTKPALSPSPQSAHTGGATPPKERSNPAPGPSDDKPTITLDVKTVPVSLLLSTQLLFINDGTRKSITNTDWNGYFDLAALLRAKGFTVEEQNLNPITLDDLASYDVVVFSPSWKCREINPSEAEALAIFVQNGGGLFLMGELGVAGWYDECLKSVNRVGNYFGIEFDFTMVCDPTNHHYFVKDPDEGVDCPIVTDIRTHGVTEGVSKFMLMWGTSLQIGAPAITIAYTDGDAWRDTNSIRHSDLGHLDCHLDDFEAVGSFSALAISQYGNGKVVAVGDSGLFVNDWLDNYDHYDLAQNIFEWLSEENLPPIASFTYTLPKQKINQPLPFNASASSDSDGNIINYKWDFGDGKITSTSEKILTHSYSSAGDYTVILTVTDNEGATDSISKIVRVSPEKVLNVPFFSQRDPAWRDKKLDHSIYSLGKYGCALTSAAMVAKYFGDDTDPDKLNTRLTAVGGLDTSGIIHWKKVEDVSDGKVAWIESVGASWSRIDQELSSENPVISSVNCPLGLHFIVFVGKSGDEHYFLDPYDKQRIIRIWPNGAHGVYTLINLKIYHGSPNTFVPSTLKVLIGTGSVVTMDLEEYVKGVVAAEMYPSWPIEALKAQAVASRTFAIANTHHDHINVDVCTDYHCCQAWVAGPYDENVEKAVTETHNEVLTYNGQIAKEALFFAHCNGHTRNSEDYCPGGNCWNYVSYLRSVACDCGFSAYYGSGVGMCQQGAKSMAEQGYSYVDILKHYYTGIEVASSSSSSSSSSPPPNYFVSNQDKIEEAISWANNEIGNDEWHNVCLKFVSLAYGLGANVNAKTTGWDWPNDAINKLGTKFYSIDNCGNPPRGALIFFSCQGIDPETKIDYEKYGHIGIYLGDGKVIHAYRTVRTQNIAGKGGIEQLDCIDSYIGWAYPPEAWLDYPLPPTLASPGSESPPGPTITTLTPTFEWNSVSTADHYGLYLRDLDMDEIVFNSRDDYGPIYGTSFPLPSGILDYGTHYRWNMNSYNSAGWGVFYSDRCWFTTYER